MRRAFSRFLSIFACGCALGVSAGCGNDSPHEVNPKPRGNELLSAESLDGTPKRNEAQEGLLASKFFGRPIRRLAEAIENKAVESKVHPGHPSMAGFVGGLLNREIVQNKRHPADSKNSVRYLAAIQGSGAPADQGSILVYRVVGSDPTRKIVVTCACDRSPEDDEVGSFAAMQATTLLLAKLTAIDLAKAKQKLPVTPTVDFVWRFDGRSGFEFITGLVEEEQSLLGVIDLGSLVPSAPGTKKLALGFDVGTGASLVERASAEVAADYARAGHWRDSGFFAFTPAIDDATAEKVGQRRVPVLRAFAAAEKGREVQGSPPFPSPAEDLFELPHRGAVNGADRIVGAPADRLTTAIMLGQFAAATLVRVAGGLAGGGP